MGNPEYKVDCLMCSGSFTATADSLVELVQLVRVHLHHMKKSSDKNHKPPKGEVYPETKDEILRSKGFGWSVLDFHPYTRLKVACQQIPTDDDSKHLSEIVARRRRGSSPRITA